MREQGGHATATRPSNGEGFGETEVVTTAADDVVGAGGDGAGAAVLAVHRNARHGFSKGAEEAITLVAGLGVEGDAHCGARVKHRSRVRTDPDQPNLRQVHLIPREVLDEAVAAGFDVAPGDLGENITTSGLDLLSMPVGTTLLLGGDALVALTGLRNPCRQIDGFAPGLLAHLRPRARGVTVLRAGVMAVVLRGGRVAGGDAISVALPPAPHRPLGRV